MWFIFWKTISMKSYAIMKDHIKVFIMDDNRYFGNMLKASLSKKNRTVKYFQSEIELIRHLNEKPEILILDHKLTFYRIITSLYEENAT
jgi:DNA-binding response OmpR family regulator